MSLLALSASFEYLCYVYGNNTFLIISAQGSILEVEICAERVKALINPYSAVINFSRHNLMSVNVTF